MNLQPNGTSQVLGCIVTDFACVFVDPRESKCSTRASIVTRKAHACQRAARANWRAATKLIRPWLIQFSRLGSAERPALTRK